MTNEPDLSPKELEWLGRELGRPVTPEDIAKYRAAFAAYNEQWLVHYERFCREHPAIANRPERAD
jgi:hypothetical protein